VIDDTVGQGRPQAGEFDWDVGRSMFFFPICGEKEPSGLIVAGAARTGQSGVDGFGDMAFALARIAAHSILNAQLYQEATRFEEQLVTLQVISKVMASATDAEALLEVVVREAGELMGGSMAWLYLQEPGEQSRLYNWPAALRHELWTTVHRDAVAWVLRASQPIFYDPQQPLSRSPILANSGPAVCVPLEAGDEAIGALVVVGRRERTFFEDDMIVLRTVANGAAAAYRVTRLSH
jgi:GAF domain-containing protein